MYRLGLAPPKSFYEVATVWPFEVFTAAVLVLGSILTVLIYAVPMPLLWVDMGPLWAVAWLVLALVAGGILSWGLWRGDLSALGAGLIMGGSLIGGYLLVANFNDAVYPSIISQALYSLTAFTAVSRGVYFQRIVGRARRRFRSNPPGR